MYPPSGVVGALCCGDLTEGNKSEVGLATFTGSNYSPFIIFSPLCCCPGVDCGVGGC
jgi:hypothetical protein